MEDLESPAKPKDMSLEDLVKELKSHYEPVTLVIGERFNFNRRCQQQWETVADFAADLKRRSAKCEFGVYLDETVKDWNWTDFMLSCVMCIFVVSD